MLCYAEFVNKKRNAAVTSLFEYQNFLTLMWQ